MSPAFATHVLLGGVLFMLIHSQAPSAMTLSSHPQYKNHKRPPFPRDAYPGNSSQNTQQQRPPKKLPLQVSSHVRISTPRRQISPKHGKDSREKSPELWMLRVFALANFSLLGASATISKQQRACHLVPCACQPRRAHVDSYAPRRCRVRAIVRSHVLRVNQETCPHSLS